MENSTESQGHLPRHMALNLRPRWRGSVQVEEHRRRVIGGVSPYALPAFVLVVLVLLLAAPVGSDDAGDLEILQRRVTTLELQVAALTRAGEALEQTVEFNAAVARATDLDIMRTSCLELASLGPRSPKAVCADIEATYREHIREHELVYVER